MNVNKFGGTFIILGAILGLINFFGGFILGGSGASGGDNAWVDFALDRMDAGKYPTLFDSFTGIISQTMLFFGFYILIKHIQKINYNPVAVFGYLLFSIASFLYIIYHSIGIGISLVTEMNNPTNILLETILVTRFSLLISSFGFALISASMIAYSLSKLENFYKNISFGFSIIFMILGILGIVIVSVAFDVNNSENNFPVFIPVFLGILLVQIFSILIGIKIRSINE